MADEDSPFRSARRARRSALAVLAAELGHDLQGPLNLFRHTAERVARGESLDAEDVSLLHEELARLSQQNARLRQLAQLVLQKESVSPHAVVAKAFELEPRRSEVELDMPTSPGAVVSCDPSLVALALAELIDNALGARATRAGVRFASGLGSGFCVWDDGEGFTLETSAALAWGTTTKQGAAGLGLTLALRIARAHGFGLRLLRTDGRTEVWLDVPEVERERGPARLMA